MIAELLTVVLGFCTALAGVAVTHRTARLAQEAARAASEQPTKAETFYSRQYAMEHLHLEPRSVEAWEHYKVPCEDCVLALDEQDYNRRFDAAHKSLEWH